MPPSVLHLSTIDAGGGAARAAYALHHAMVEAGITSTLRVAQKFLDDPTVVGLDGADRLRFLAAQQLDHQLWRLQHSPRSTWRSPARFGALDAKTINASSADIVNLHWVTNGYLTVEQIGDIRKPIVWSLYDMWPFAGTEHYGADTPDARWRAGYTKENRPADESGLDLDRWAWERKRAHWTRPAHVVAASTWLHDCSSASALFGSWPQHRIPHVVDSDVFTVCTRESARTELGLPLDRPLVLFLASAGISDRRKGWDLLDQALTRLRETRADVEVIVVGPAGDAERTSSGLPIHWRGTVDGDVALAAHYAAASVVAVPSREDNMPLTAMEAQSSGRPVVAFSIGGLPDIVEHHATGFLAEPFHTDSLATGLIEAVADSENADAWGRAARERALATWSQTPVIEQYLDVYAQAMR